MNLDEAVYRELTKGRHSGGMSPRTEVPRSTEDIVKELKREHGVKPPEGISVRTWRRARNEEGWKPTPRVRDALDAAMRKVERRARLSAGREAKLRRPASIGVAAKVTVSSDTRVRRLLMDRWDAFTPADGAEIVDRFLNGEREGLGEPIAEIIRAQAGAKDVELDDVKAVRFFSDPDEAKAWYRSRD